MAVFEAGLYGDSTAMPSPACLSSCQDRKAEEESEIPTMVTTVKAVELGCRRGRYHATCLTEPGLSGWDTSVLNPKQCLGTEGNITGLINGF